MTASDNNFAVVPPQQISKFQQIAVNSANMDDIKIMHWNCRGFRGLSNKISDLLVFLNEKDSDIV